MIAAGLDPSLTSTGLCLLDTDTGEVEVMTIKSKPNGLGGSADYLRRFADIATEVYSATMNADLLAIEAPNYGANRSSSTAAHQLAGLWWHLAAVTRPDLEVPPSVLKKYATGSGNAGKDIVLSSVVRRYKRADVNGNDEADATVLAYLVARLAGHPAEDGPLPKAHLEALKKVSLPE